jgi:hypothetical protein
MRPNPVYHPSGFRDFLVRATQGELEIDRKVAIFRRDRKGRPLEFHLIPPDDVKPRPEVLGLIQQQQGLKNEDEVFQYVWNEYRMDISNSAYIQEKDGIICGAWEAYECSVDVTSPRYVMDNWMYGESCLERSLPITTLLLRAFAYNENLFSVNWPEAILGIHGDFDPVGLEAIKAKIYGEVGEQGEQRLPIIPIGDSENILSVTKLRDTPREMMYADLLRFAIALKAASYRAHPSILNMATDNGGQAPIISNADQDTQIDMAQEEGLHSLLGNFAHWLTREIVEPYYPDLEMVWSVQDQPTEQQSIELWEKKLQMGETVNEYRASKGLQPLEEVTNGVVDGNYLNSQFFFEQQQQAMAQAQALAQTALPTTPGGGDNTPNQPGQPPGQPNQQQA